MNVKDKVIVVTGAGSGIGRQLALTLIKKGARVAAIDINGQNLEETRKECKEKSTSLACFTLDITDHKAVKELPEKVCGHFGQIDGIINNAGIIQPFIRVSELEFETIKRVMDINFYGTIYMIKAFLPILTSRPEAYIVNISSMGALVPVPGQVIYGASKSAVKLLTEGLISELSDTTIKVSVVFPGAVNTNITANSGADELPVNGGDKSPKSMKILSAREAAEIIISGVEKNKSRIIAGKDARFLDILSRLSPLTAAKLIYRHMANLLK